MSSISISENSDVLDNLARATAKSTVEAEETNRVLTDKEKESVNNQNQQKASTMTPDMRRFKRQLNTVLGLGKCIKTIIHDLEPPEDDEGTLHFGDALMNVEATIGLDEYLSHVRDVLETVEEWARETEAR